MNIKGYFSDVKEYFSPLIIGEVNDAYVKVAKIKGDKVPWHNHKKEDELFFILEGSLFLELEGRDGFTMNEGDIFIVKKGLNHRVSSIDECKILLIENKTTAHTGDVVTEITKSTDQQLR